MQPPQTHSPAPSQKEKQPPPISMEQLSVGFAQIGDEKLIQLDKRPKQPRHYTGNDDTSVLKTSKSILGYDKPSVRKSRKTFSSKVGNKKRKSNSKQRSRNANYMLSQSQKYVAPHKTRSGKLKFIKKKISAF